MSQRSNRLSFGVGLDSQRDLCGMERKNLRGETALRAAWPQVLPLWATELFGGKLQTATKHCYVLHVKHGGARCESV